MRGAAKGFDVRRLYALTTSYVNGIIRFFVTRPRDSALTHVGCPGKSPPAAAEGGRQRPRARPDVFIVGLSLSQEEEPESIRTPTMKWQA